jgi:nucleolar MIF4G domain-containing protein 1
LWDFLRDLGEKSVGGQELVKNINNDNDNVTAKVSDRKVENLGKLFGWCVGKQALSITILKVSIHHHIILSISFFSPSY